MANPRQVTLDKITDGEVVILPSDGVYTMNCNVFNKETIKKLYLLKEKEMSYPFTVAVSNLSVVENLITLNELEQKIISKLIEAFWPGQLTIMMPCKDRLDLCYVKNKTIAVCSPNNPIQQFILNELGSPMITTSANTYGEPCNTNLLMIKKKYQKMSVHIHNSKTKSSGLENTIVKIKNNRVGIMRLGMITEKEIIKTLEEFQVDIDKYIMPIPIILNKKAVFAQFITGDNIDKSFLEHNMLSYVKEYLRRSILIDFGKKNYEKKNLCAGYVDLSENGDIKEAIFNFYSIIQQLNSVKCRNIIFVDLYRNKNGLHNVLIDKIERCCATKNIFIPVSYN